MIDPTAEIHSSAIVEEGAQIGAGAKIGPFCVIGAQARLGEGVICYSHVVVAGDTEIGAGTRIWPFASIGHQPQDLKYNGEPTKLIIGKNNMIRESTSINIGTEGGGGITRIGDNNLFMIGSHIGHDCIIGSNIVFANNAAIAGHVIVEDNVIIGGQSGIIQFARIGKGAMIGAGSLVASDVVPYAMTIAERPYIAGLNYVGLRRRGASKDDIRALKDVLDELFKSEEGLRSRAEALVEHSPNDLAQEMIDFVLGDSRCSFLRPK